MPNTNYGFGSGLVKPERLKSLADLVVRASNLGNEVSDMSDEEFRRADKSLAHLCVRISERRMVYEATRR